jgi:hypothetical protein
MGRKLTSRSLATESSQVDVAFCPRFHKTSELIGRRWTGAVCANSNPRT